MKTSLLSLVAALGLFASTTASAATTSDPGRDLRRMSPIERARYEKAQRENERRAALERARLAEVQRQQALERARIAEAQRRADQQKAAERARWGAQHRNDRGNGHGR